MLEVLEHLFFHRLLDMITHTCTRIDELLFDSDFSLELCLPLDVVEEPSLSHFLVFGLQLLDLLFLTLLSHGQVLGSGVLSLLFDVDGF